MVQVLPFIRLLEVLLLEERWATFFLFPLRHWEKQQMGENMNVWNLIQKFQKFFSFFFWPDSRTFNEGCWKWLAQLGLQCAHLFGCLAVYSEVLHACCCPKLCGRNPAGIPSLASPTTQWFFQPKRRWEKQNEDWSHSSRASAPNCRLQYRLILKTEKMEAALRSTWMRVCRSTADTGWGGTTID